MTRFILRAAIAAVGCGSPRNGWTASNIDAPMTLSPAVLLAS